MAIKVMTHSLINRKLLYIEVTILLFRPYVLLRLRGLYTGLVLINTLIQLQYMHLEFIDCKLVVFIMSGLNSQNATVVFVNYHMKLL